MRKTNLYSYILRCKHTPSFMLLFFSSLLFFCNSFSLAAQPGTIDTSFSNNGIASLDLNNSNDLPGDVIIQPDGKIIVAGTSIIDIANISFTVARFKEDGSLDTTFANNGVAQTPFSGDHTYVSAAALQSDGKIVVAGTSGPEGDSQITVVRYTTDGDLDSTFGSNGVVTTAVFPTTHNWGGDLAIQPDGKILVAGTVSNTGYDFVLLRYNLNGSADNSFGSNGIKVFDVAGGDWDFGYALALQQNGKIIVAGRSGTNASNYDFALARFNDDGTPDTGFGTNGAVVTHLTDGYDKISRLALQPDGKILAVGTRNDSELALTRYLSTGSLDEGFGSTGIAFTTLGKIGSDIFIQDNGKILVSGVKGGESSDDLIAVVIRFTTSGNFDSSFGNDGLYKNNFGVVYGNAGQGLALQQNGRIITTGFVDNGTGAARPYDIFIIRLFGDSFSWPLFIPAMVR